MFYGVCVGSVHSSLQRPCSTLIKIKNKHVYMSMMSVTPSVHNLNVWIFEDTNVLSVAMRTMMSCTVHTGEERGGEEWGGEGWGGEE